MSDRDTKQIADRDGKQIKSNSFQVNCNLILSFENWKKLQKKKLTNPIKIPQQHKIKWKN